MSITAVMNDIRLEARALAMGGRGGAAALLADETRTPSPQAIVRLYREAEAIREWIKDNSSGASVEDFRGVVTATWDRYDELLRDKDMQAGELSKAAAIAERKLANSERLALAGWTADKLACTAFEPIRWVINGLVSEGLVVLAGAPKLGKSWFALMAIFGVAHGTQFLGRFETVRAGAAYLALEDSPRRLQDRMARLHLKPTPDVHLFCEWPRMPQGLDLLDDFLEEHPEIRLVIIDTLARLRPLITAESGGGTAYDADYDLLAPLKAVADRRHAAILVVTHLRKAVHDDVFMRITGSAAISGAADAMLLLDRKRGKPEGTLTTTSRDAPEIEAALRFDIDAGGWQIVEESPEEAGQTPERKAILELLHDSPAPMRTSDIAEALGKAKATISEQLKGLFGDGIVERPIYGHYRISALYKKVPNSPNTPNVPPSPFGAFGAFAPSLDAIEQEVTE